MTFFKWSKLDFFVLQSVWYNRENCTTWDDLIECCRNFYPWNQLLKLFASYLNNVKEPLGIGYLFAQRRNGLQLSEENNFWTISFNWLIWCNHVIFGRGCIISTRPSGSKWESFSCRKRAKNWSTISDQRIMN